ncbi:MAG: hypothetical protein IKF68_05355 [Erysipelotrichaceae bacterium]|nr:hypothetical protein [Erysipelotrichaceae bacterium]
MEPKIVYPIPESQSFFYRRFRFIMRIVFIVAAFTCVLVNILVKGKAWSVVVVWSLYMTWKLAFSLKLVEFSIFSHATRSFLYIIILLGLIGFFLAPGWAEIVIPIVFFGSFLIMIILYFAIYSRRDRHLVSIMLLGLSAVLSIPYSLHSWPIDNWLAFAFALASLILFILMIVICRKEIRHELKNRFRR